MKNACPSAFSLLVAVAVSSSIIAPKALADRRLQIRSVDIQANEQVEFVQSEIMVRPTLGDDQQPIPGSFTTTYPDRYGVSAGYIVPAIGFTDVLSDFDGRVSSVDQFETDENNAARKYTKVLKLVDEGIFRFTHNLQEKELVIEVRVGMTDWDSLKAVRSQWTDMESLEPITKIARPKQLFALLVAAGERAGNLGTRDDYVTLATIEVDKVEVNGRTFMRLVSGGDQPPELERLGQSLFVNDDALLAAATSAYIKVHVLGGELQQQALNKLLAASKPVGYVVHVEGHSRAYPVPAGYPKLEVAETPGEVIVFHSQRLNPDDIAFVENLYDLWQEAKDTPPNSAILTEVKTHKVKGYQYVVRSRQMAVLEEFAAQHAAEEVTEDQPTTFLKKDRQAMRALAYYESLHLALATATPDEKYGINEFPITQEHIRVALSVVTPNWMHNQLAKHFSFKPAFRDLLINEHFFRKIFKYIPAGPKLRFNILYDDIQFVSKILGERNKQIMELFNKLDKLESERAELVRFKRELEIESYKAGASDEKKLELKQLYQKIKDKHARVLNEQKDQGNLHRLLMKDVKRIPPLEKKVWETRIKTITAPHPETAIAPGMDDLDETQPLDEQVRRFLEKTDDTRGRAVVESQLVPVNEADPESQLVQPDLQQEHTRTEAEIKAHYATLAAHLEIQDFDSSADIDVQQEWLVQKIKTITAGKKVLHQQLKTIADPEEEIDRRPAHPEIMSEAHEKLTAVEKALKMDGHKSEVDVYHRRNAISEKIQSYTTRAEEEAEQEALDILETLEEILKIEVNKEDSKATRLARVRDRFHCDIPKYMLREMEAFIWKMEMTWNKDQRIRLWQLLDFIELYVETPDPDARVLRQQKRMLEALENELNIDKSENPAAIERGREEAAELALVLKVEFDKGASLNDQKDALKAGIQALWDQVNNLYFNRDREMEGYNKIARQLNVRVYEEYVYVDKQIKVIETALREFEKEVDRVGRPDVNERIVAIENELDRQIAPGAEPRYIPEVTTDKPALNADGEEVENTGGSFQYTPEQAEVLHAIQTFTQQHPLKRQALQVASGLAELAVTNGKAIPNLPTYDFDDEFAAIRLQVLVGDKLTFDQTSRIVQIFRALKATFPEYPASEDEPRSPLEEVQMLVHRARNEMESGAQQYDKEIFGMGKTAIHCLEREPGDLKTFPEYFATRSASGNRIMTLLHEGLISKVELENYIKAVRGTDSYQTVAEFEHFLGYKHSVELTHFKAAVRMLSDRGVEKLIQSAFTPVTATAPAAMKESVVGMEEYAAAVIANYVLDDIAFDNGRRTAAFLANIQNTLTSYVNAAGLSESELIKAIHNALMQAHAAAVEQQLNDYWVKPSAFLVQAVTWYFSNYKPLLATHTAGEANALSLSNMAFLYLLDLTNRGDYTHRILTPFQHWLEGYGVDLDRTGQYAYHSEIEKISEVSGLAMPLGRAASSVILLRTGSMLFARQYNANPQMYRSISRLVPEIVKSMGSGQGVQVPLLHRVTPQKVKTLASATASLVLGPVATVGAYAHGLISGFTYAQTFGLALASSLTFDFFMNDNKMLTQWLGGPLGRSLDKVNRWLGVGETDDEYAKRTAIAAPQDFGETDQEYANRIKANNTIYGWARHENYLQFRERRDRTLKLFENGWEKYFRENMPKWSFSHAESIPYFYTLGVFYQWQKGDDQKVHGHDKSNAPQSGSLSATMIH